MREEGRVHLAVYDLSGRLVATLADEEREAGPLVRTWDGTADSGTASSSGVYFVRLTTRSGAVSTKVVLMK